MVTFDQLTKKQILYANEHNIPFTAKSGGHGAIDSLGKVRSGIEISMRKLNHTDVSSNGQYVTVGGGAIAKEIITALSAAGKRTTTGYCECVGLLGSLLGGGHGLLQGQYGLMVDQLLEARLVLANGSAITVSENSHPDLFWALKGAGHNFGVATEVKLKLYDAPRTNWTSETLIFTGDKLEELYSLANRMAAKQPLGLTNFGIFVSMPDIDPEKPVILLAISHDGPPSIEQAYSATFRALGPVSATLTELPYDLLPAAIGFDLDSPPCQPGENWLRYPIDLEKYDVAALREVYELWSQTFRDFPALNRSIFALEGYAVQAVQEVPAESTAYPNREDNLLLSSFITYNFNESIDATARYLGERSREILYKASNRTELHSYVNYAHGDEGVRSWYGYEPWRLEKLRRLKREYDPLERFKFYAPIGT